MKNKKTAGSKLKFTGKFDYAPAPESKDHIRIKERYELFINGKFTAPESGKYFPSINPADETKIAEIAEAGEKDVDKAVRAARSAYEKTWSKIPA